jgi:hypothetical protein
MDNEPPQPTHTFLHGILISSIEGPQYSFDSYREPLRSHDSFHAKETGLDRWLKDGPYTPGHRGETHGDLEIKPTTLAETSK